MIISSRVNPAVFAAKIKYGSSIYVLTKKRPNHFNLSGAMDYLLDRGCVAKVVSVGYDAVGGVESIIITRRENNNYWILELDSCEVGLILEDTHSKAEIREGDI